MNHTTDTQHNQAARHQGQAIEVLDEHFNSRRARIDDDRVTGRQIAEAAGFNSIDEVIVLQQLPSGALEELRPEELVDLAQPGLERFFVIEDDATYRFFLDGLKLEWPRARVNASTCCTWPARVANSRSCSSWRTHRTRCSTLTT